MSKLTLYDLAIMSAVALYLFMGQPVGAESFERDTLFDRDWRFCRGDVPGAETPEHDDSDWSRLHLPHDWSIEDLPARSDRTPTLSAVEGEWRFHRGDDMKWKERAFDDRGWEQVSLPENWEDHSGYHDRYSYGWYRRQLDIPEEYAGQDLILLLGRIDDADETYLNGVKIGGTGSIPPNFQTAWDVDRRYKVPASLIRGDGTDALAVRVFDGENDGGMYAAGQEFERIGPFDPTESAGGLFTGHTVGGTSWYRKHFTVDESGQCTAIRFDGVYMVSDVWINGHHVGQHPHGYTAFEFDLTPHLNAPGEDNVLAVRVDNEGRNSRWYSGSGIYRHVWLTRRNPIHVPTWGVFVTTPEVTAEQATVNVSVEVANTTTDRTQATVRVRVHDADGQVVAESEDGLRLPAEKTQTLDLAMKVASPALWSTEMPNLYSAAVEVHVNDEAVDSLSTTFGIRKIEFDAKRGFRLNGVPMLMKGGNIHHDNGPLGAKAIDRAEERRVELLKTNGYNAIRCAHNPPSLAFLEACDRLGMLVIDEAFDCWNEPKEHRTESYHRFFEGWYQRDIASMVRRGRNHPSIIMWSVGNEIPEQFRDPDTGMRLRKEVLSHDTTRPVTQAICTDWGRVFQNWAEESDPAFGHLDVAGYNYLPQFYKPDHARHPDRIMYGSETYAKDALYYWSLTEELPYVIGDFVWTAMDYLGESGIGHALAGPQNTAGLFMPWPYFNAWCGDLDLGGFKKPQSYYRDVVWGESRIEMVVSSPLPEGVTEIVSWWGWPNEAMSWNWAGREGEPLQVKVYSDCERVRLELNGEVIGENPVSRQTQLTAFFEVPYQPGELRAVGLIDGEAVAETGLTTSGPPQRIRLTADRSQINADRNDLAYVTVEVVDNAGRRVPDAELSIEFAVRGVGDLVAHTNGYPKDPASFTSSSRVTYQGRCLAILQPTGKPGEVILEASVDGLEPASLIIQCTE